VGIVDVVIAAGADGWGDESDVASVTRVCQVESDGPVLDDDQLHRGDRRALTMSSGTLHRASTKMVWRFAADSFQTLSELSHANARRMVAWSVASPSQARAEGR